MRSGEIRQACRLDAPAICDLHQRSVRGLNAEDYSPDEIEAWVGSRKPEHYIKRMEDEVFVVVADPSETDRLIGFGAIWFDRTGSGQAEVRSVYVDPLFSGAGIGTLLLQRLEDEAQRRGIEILQLNSSTTAVPFYERNGYKPLEKVAYPLGGGRSMPCMRMQKALQKDVLGT